MNTQIMPSTFNSSGLQSMLPESGTIVVVDERNLVSECIARCIKTQRPQNLVLSYTSVLDCITSVGSHHDEILILYSIGGSEACGETFLSALESFEESFSGTPIIVIADNEDAIQILKSLDSGVRGYIPTSASLRVALEAMDLVEVGGTFIPASSLMSSRKSIMDRSERCSLQAEGTFTARQAAVVEALRQGKANKIIAYELNMRESTVKVHVRNIMKKLRAKNRTEVAYITNSRINESA